MEQLLDRKVPAAALFSGPYYFAEQLGFRKIMDSTFMIATMLTGDPDPEDVRKYFRALRRAQFDIDLRPELYTHYYKKEFPVRFHEQMDTRRWGPGERIVFESYTKQAFEDSFEWIAQRGIFPEGQMRVGQYRSSRSLAGFGCLGSVFGVLRGSRARWFWLLRRRRAAASGKERHSKSLRCRATSFGKVDLSAPIAL